ncbi:hypothetical protein [Thermoproteus tenax]|uniref:Uncharacterized protein n=1 Tax=Thermoproteus tenax (strain ATCC 35583 / DSM 2078 / JCM 9277 / NBRC 100435 / Kra 1) TaxID=768679 RepID=G4RLH1_THETK|nr:hypothetical protein [Thermoproteus tenax]CCC82416.1 conserved hypothetical protein [Thermoproteus tenax Kra 1]
MSEFVKPIYARAFFNMDSTGLVTQFMVFYYSDPKAYYAGLSREELEEELETARENMQAFLDEEVIKINGERVRARVVRVDLGLMTINLAHMTFLIDFKGNLKRGLNVYEDIYEEEVAEYPYEFLWRFPGRIVRATVAGRLTVEGGVLHVKVPAGTKVGGSERVEFLLD